MSTLLYNLKKAFYQNQSIHILIIFLLLNDAQIKMNGFKNKKSKVNDLLINVDYTLPFHY